jgi:flagellar basal-body rod modification protein FlgD
MTTVSGTNASSGSTSTSSQPTPTVDYNSFLQLLIAQMQNQDPLNPTDSTQFVTQLATFSNVEQGVNTNSKLDQLLTISNLTQASTMVGHSLTSSDGTVSGIIESVRVDSSGATAILTDGQQITIDQGVTIGY